MIRMALHLHDFEIDDAGLNSVLYGEKGPVARHMIKIGNRTVRLAKRYAGKDTGALRASIEWSRNRTLKREFGIWVTANVRHALVHHEGSKAHVITAKRGGVLSFRGKSGRVTTKSVRHPGTKANPYLVKAMVEAIAR